MNLFGNGTDICLWHKLCSLTVDSLNEINNIKSTGVCKAYICLRSQPSHPFVQVCY